MCDNSLLEYAVAMQVEFAGQLVGFPGADAKLAGALGEQLLKSVSCLRSQLVGGEGRMI